MNIRLSKLTDLSAIVAVQASCYEEVNPERPEVLGEKLTIYPKGCFVLEIDNKVVGYMFSHPWQLDSPPKLDTFLSQIPNDPDCYYIHDIAIDPSFRGVGGARMLFDKALCLATEQSYKHLSLIAVQDSERFWSKLGFFRYEHQNENMPKLEDTLSNYQNSALYMMKDICTT